MNRGSSEQQKRLEREPADFYYNDWPLQFWPDEYEFPFNAPHPIVDQYPSMSKNSEDTNRIYSSEEKDPDLSCFTRNVTLFFT